MEYVFEQSGKFKLVVEPLTAAVNSYADPQVIKTYEEQNQGKYSIKKVNLLTAKELDYENLKELSCTFIRVINDIYTIKGGRVMDIDVLY